MLERVLVPPVPLFAVPAAPAAPLLHQLGAKAFRLCSRAAWAEGCERHQLRRGIERVVEAEVLCRVRRVCRRAILLSAVAEVIAPVEAFALHRFAFYSNCRERAKDSPALRLLQARVLSLSSLSIQLQEYLKVLRNSPKRFAAGVLAHGFVLFLTQRIRLLHLFAGVTRTVSMVS